MTSTEDLKARLTVPKGERFVVVGAGRTGLAAARLLVQEGADVVLTDDRETSALTAALPEELATASNFEVAGGGLSLGDITDTIVVLSPGVPRSHAELQRAIAGGVPVVHEIEVALGVLGVFAGRHKVAVAAVTGTNGKSTTTSMLGAILSQQDPRAFVGGNLGRPLCEAVLDGERPTTLALELSSYQLETLTLLPVRAAIVTNLSPDHLDRYPSEADYYAAKGNLFQLVTDRGGISLNGKDRRTEEHLRAKACGKLRFDFAATADADVGVSILGATLQVRSPDGQVATLEVDNDRIVGPHNIENAAAAVAASALLGIPPSTWRKGLAAYEGISHRMEVVGTNGGVTFVNDSKATNVDAAAVAIQSFQQGVHLIAGGVGKGSSYAPMVEAGRGRLKAVYTIGEDAPAIAAAFGEAAAVVDSKTLDAAFAKALASAVAGDVVLLAPACASFDQFPNYAVRGQAFIDLVRQAEASLQSFSNSQTHDESAEAPRSSAVEGA